MTAALLMVSASSNARQDDPVDSGGDKVTPASSPEGAIVREVSGGVQADAGAGLAPAVIDQILPPASRVLVQDASFTILSFGKDCDIRLEPGDWRVPNPSVATVAEVVGGVQLFQNEAFNAVTPNQPVKVGDRILVQAESSAVLRFETGCDIKLDPGITEVPDGCRCLAALWAGNTPAAAPFSPWVGGALLVGGAVLVMDNDERRPPISP
jgi:hypothetical protein